MPETVFVSEHSYRRGERVYEEVNRTTEEFRFVPVNDSDEAELGEKIRKAGVRAFVASGVSFRGPLYEALPEGGVIVRFGVGHEGIDKEKAAARGIWVANTPECLENAVAEHGLWLMGCLARALADQFQDMAEGKWVAREGIELGGRTLAVVGFGRIGQVLCRKAALGLGMEVIGCGRAAPEAWEEGMERSMVELRRELGFARYTDDLDAALTEADFVVILATSTKETRHLVGREFLGKMKEGAFLINLARGALVNENELYDALELELIAGAALDVFETEPYAPSGPLALELDPKPESAVPARKDLRMLPNVILTPHTASHTVEANDAMARCTVETVMIALTKGVEGLGNLVN